jgi:ribosomal protein S18 acetylase RimI-like enzyme
VSAFTYRVAVDGDAEALATFARESWAATFAHVGYPPEDLAAYLVRSFGADIQRGEIADPEVRYRLAFDDQGIAGYCMMGDLMMPVEEVQAVELHRLYVHERAKGRGVADALMDDCIRWARAKDASALYLSVWENNERAQRFYRRYGFADHGEWDFMVGQTADRDLIWRLTL